MGWCSMFKIEAYNNAGHIFEVTHYMTYPDETEQKRYRKEVSKRYKTLLNIRVSKSDASKRYMGVA